MNRRMLIWFVLGFVVSFIILAVALTTYVMLPSADAVMVVPLWRYYVLAAPCMFQIAPMGPASPSLSALFSHIFQHLALSVPGGIVVAGVAWWFGRRPLKSA